MKEPRVWRVDVVFNVSGLNCVTEMPDEYVLQIGHDDASVREGSEYLLVE